MAEKTVEQIAAAQLNYDVAEAMEFLANATELSNVAVGGIENLIGKVVMRWWFARACRNRLAVEGADPAAIEERRRVRAAKYVATTQIVNAKANKGQAPGNLDLQMGMLDLIGNCNAIWQALFDAGIIHPNAKQDYLDAGCDELYNRVVGFSQKIDLGKSPSVDRDRH